MKIRKCKGMLLKIAAFLFLWYLIIGRIEMEKSSGKFCLWLRKDREEKWNGVRYFMREGFQQTNL